MKKRTDLIKQIMANMRAVKRHMMLSKKNPMDITPAQWEILHSVLLTSSQSTKDLAKQLDISNSAITQHVNVLVEKKLLKRQEDPDDRRLIHIEATSSFKRKAKKMHEMLCERTSGLFDALTTEELGVFANLHEKISHHITQQKND